MKKRSLIIGMGIGQLYLNVLTNLGHEVITVDTDVKKNADFLTVNAAINAYGCFDTVHICTPNFTHFDLAYRVAKHAGIVFIEKPGVANSEEWNALITEFPQTRFMMVKNNMWRSNINELREQAKNAGTVDLVWLNRDRVPNPGTWFTTKELAYGGVSRDLMPHLLSLYIALNTEWRTTRFMGLTVNTNWLLEDLTQTDYGVVKADGTYDVDDECKLRYGHKWNLNANWRTNDIEWRKIIFSKLGNTTEFELGLCPEDAYQAMISEAVAKIKDDAFWALQNEIDIWIHEQIQRL
jgi:predicted dehydrogenase